MRSGAGIEARRIVNGTYGTVYIDGQWYAQFNKADITIDISKSEIKLAGSRWTHHKVVGVKGTGKLSGFKINSEIIEMGLPVVDDWAKPPRFMCIVSLRDPESYGFESIKLSGCMFDKIHLSNWEVQKEIEEDLDFTFEGCDLLDKIVTEGGETTYDEEQD